MDLNIVGLIINVPEFIWTIINFFLLLFLLKKILYDPVLKHMDERSERIEGALREGREAETELGRSSAELAQELAESGRLAREQISEARSEAEKCRAETLEKAHLDAGAIQKGVREKISDEESDAKRRIEDDMPELVALLTNRLLGCEAAEADSSLVKDCIGANKE